MLKLSQYGLIASLMTVALALVCYILVLTLGRSVRKAPARVHATVGAGPGGSFDDVDELDADRRGTSMPIAASPRALAQYGTYFTWLAFAFLTSCLVFLTLATGHGPFTNQYEFSVSFGWGILASYIYFEHKYHVRTIALLILPIAGALLLYAFSLGTDANPLVPALQNPFLLTIHVAVATVAYGAFAVSFATAALYLIQPPEGKPGLPKLALLDEIGYRAVIIGFPLLTMTVVLGAVWAEKAWGSYWTWDPKETASLISWLIYGAFLHARVARGWVGRRAAWLLVLGFVSVLFCFFGNLFFGGLHSYA